MQLSDFASYPNLVAMFLDRAEFFGDRPFLWAKCGGDWQSMSWREAADQVCLLAEALRGLGLEPGDRVVLAPASDGGYVLIGLKAEHPELFADIPWSTPAVYAATVARAEAAGLPVAMLPMWYDIDDAETFAILQAELAGQPLPFETALRGGPALATRALLGLTA